MRFPINCAHMLLQSPDKVIFRIPSGKLCTFKSNIELILAILKRSTGNVSTEKISKFVSDETSIPAPIVLDAIEDLFACDILIDSREQFLLYHSLSQNPPQYSSNLSFSEIEHLTENRPDYTAKRFLKIYSDDISLSTPISSVLKERHSCRSFLNLPVEREKLFAICRVSYNFELAPVASAGALFPLSLYFINKISSKTLPIGLYQYDPEKGRILLLKTDIIHEMLQYALNDENAVFGAPCIFFVCADIKRHAKKYSNRGYQFTLLEAGHSVQNMTIITEELGLGGVEYGGFYDNAVKILFDMPEDVYPLACYAVGYENFSGVSNKEQERKDERKYLIEKIINLKSLELAPFFLEDEQFKQSSLQVVVSQFKESSGRMEFGTGIDTTYGSAFVKSVMESYERYIVSCRYADWVGSAKRLDCNYLDPSEYAPYSENQLMKFGFKKFQIDDTIEWLKGYDLHGGSIYVPADLCFDVADSKYPLYHIANTSGCAAHFCAEAAEKAALLELIERDAIMRSWLYQQPPNKINIELIPEYVKNRLRYYVQQGTLVFILSLSCEYAYTVLVCSKDETQFPYFVSGAAASFLSFNEALVKAFNEWEVSFVVKKTRKK